MNKYFQDLLLKILNKVTNPNLANEAWEHQKIITPYDYAHKFIGISESTHSHLIESFHEAAGLKAGIETPWCASFMVYCFKQCGYQTNANSWAKSWLNYGSKITNPMEGCIVILSRGHSLGHVGWYVRESKEKDFIICLGGNQDNMVCEKPYHKNRILGYRNYL